MTSNTTAVRRKIVPRTFVRHDYAVLLLVFLPVQLLFLGGVCHAFCPSPSLQLLRPIQQILPLSTGAETETILQKSATTKDNGSSSRGYCRLGLKLVSSSSSVVSSQENDDEENNNDTNSSKSNGRRFMYMTEEEDRLLKEKGDLEESLMQRPTPLKALKLTGLAKSTSSGAGKGMGGGFGGGFGGGKASSKKGGKSKKKNKKQQQQEAAAPTTMTVATVSPVVRALTKAIREDGLVRIDNILSAEKADDLRDYLIDLRKRSREDVESGKIEDSQERFADVLLNQNRCDLKIPLGPKAVHEALLDVLNDEISEKDSDDATATSNPSLVRSVIEGVFDHYNDNRVYKGSDASLWELNCFMSNSGARRQLVKKNHARMVPTIMN